MKHRNYLLLLSSVAWLAGAGCQGEKNKSTSDQPTLRLANATPTSLTANAAGVSDTTAAISLTAAAAGISSYKSAPQQTYNVGVSAADGSLIASTQSLGLTTKTNYTLLAYQRNGAINTLTITDNQVAPASGFTSLAIANAGGDAGPLDVYLVAPNTALNSVSPQYANISSKTTTTSRAITAGQYDIIVTASGKPAEVRLTMPDVTLQSGDILELALTSTIGGGLVDGVMVHQGGALQLYPASTARVRLVGGLPANGATNSIVSATVGATSLAVLTAPAVGGYKLVAGNTSTYTVIVNGTAITDLPAATFANGGDYTILAYGSAAMPYAAVFTDNNQPSSSGAANLRLVNAAVTGGGITLNDNFLPINADVQYGTASDYSPATASTTSLLQITSPVSAYPPYTASNVNIASSGIYTVFVLGSTAVPTTVLSKDR